MGLTTATTAIMELPSANNRRQPVRSARTHTIRAAPTVSAVGRGMGSSSDGADTYPPAYFPAITHFTDAITALPREMVRHYTMLKEVDAKIYGPEERLSRLLEASLSDASDTIGVADGKDLLPDPQHPDFNHPRFSRQRQLAEMRRELGSILMTLDEKNHVMVTAIEALNKQLSRCKDVFPHVEEEFSEEARLGSMTHWAYTTESPTEKKGIMAGERTRRANNFAAENEPGPARHDHRRDPLVSRKGRNANVDSDFDDARTNGKKGQTNAGRGRKPADLTSMGPNASGPAGPPNKKRKVEKAEQTDFAKKTVPPGFGTAARGGSPASDVVIKRKPRGGSMLVNNGRRRGNTNTSAASHPHTASSPIIGTFTASGRDRRGRSPNAPALQRMPSSRGSTRQTPSQHVVPTVERHRPPAKAVEQQQMTPKAEEKSGIDVEKAVSLGGRSTGEVRNSLKENVNGKGDQIDEEAIQDGDAEMRDVPSTGSRHNSMSESTNGKPRVRTSRPPSISISTRGGASDSNGRSKPASKAGTPMTANFATSTTRRPASRNLDGPPAPAKRSHKKGAGIAAQIAAAAAATRPQSNDEDGAQLPDGPEAGDEEDEEDGKSAEEPRYCYCNDFSYGEMVGCDADDCKREWFHLDCVGLNRAPSRSAKWYCNDCRDHYRR